MEWNYEFRKRLEIVHKPDRRQEKIVLQPDELLIEDGWTIIISTRAAQLIVNVAKDLQDYLFTSMRVSVLVKRSEDLANDALHAENVIVLATKEELTRYGAELSVPRSYRYVCTEKRVIICGCDEQGVGQGS